MMYKVWITLGLSLLPYASPSPVGHYEREITPKHTVFYYQKDGNFSFTTTKLVDSDNIYNHGKIDSYDDPYIHEILAKQKPIKVIPGGKRVLSIGFKSEANKKNFLKEFGLSLFKEYNLTLKLYRIDASLITLPMQLKVYPFFVINDRFSQGFISRTILEDLIHNSDYTQSTKEINLFQLKERLKEKYKITEEQFDIQYNDTIKLFEIYQKPDGTLPLYYISSDGRYIIKP